MRTILITGANRGLGLELSRQYYAEGWRIIACCRNPKEAEELRGIESDNSGRLMIMKLDVADPDAIRNVAKQLDNETIDILMNNAGVIGMQLDTLKDIDADAWVETFKVNSIAPILLAQHLIKQIMRSNLKIICNVTSILGSISLNEDGNYYLYRSSKAALNAATKCLANELKPQDIIVFALNPGWVQTDMGGENALLTPEESIKNIRKLLAGIGLADSGKFINYDGAQLSW